MKRWTWAMAFLFAGIFVAGNISQGAEVYKLGTVACITGGIPQHGEYTLRGFKLALEDVEKGGMLKGEKLNWWPRMGKMSPEWLWLR